MSGRHLLEKEPHVDEVEVRARLLAQQLVERLRPSERRGQDVRASHEGGAREVLERGRQRRSEASLKPGAHPLGDDH